MLYYRKNAQEELIKTFWMPELKIDDFPEIVTPQFTTELSIASLSFVEIQFLQEIDYALSLVYLDRRIEWVFSFGRKGKKTSVEGGRQNRLSVGRLSRFIGQTVNEVSNKTMNPNSTMLLSFFDTL